METVTMRQFPAGHRLKRLLGSLGCTAALSLSGCQVDIGGQTLPSPYWQTDDVQYFPAGPEFKLSREAAAMAAFQDEQLRAGLVNPGGVPGGVPGGPVPAVPGDMPPDVLP